MKEMQKSAVEWLCNEWLYLDQQFDMCLIDRNIYWDKLRQIQEQAKEMEKEQKISLLEWIRNNAVEVQGGWQYDNWTYTDKEILEVYYNETFKSE